MERAVSVRTHIRSSRHALWSARLLEAVDAFDQDRTAKSLRSWRQG
jgi:hypothetical protein